VIRIRFLTSGSFRPTNRAAQFAISAGPFFTGFRIRDTNARVKLEAAFVITSFD